MPFSLRRAAPLPPFSCDELGGVLTAFSLFHGPPCFPLVYSHPMCPLFCCILEGGLFLRIASDPLPPQPAVVPFSCSVCAILVMTFEHHGPLLTKKKLPWIWFCSTFFALPHLRKLFFPRPPPSIALDPFKKFAREDQIRHGSAIKEAIHPPFPPFLHTFFLSLPPPYPLLVPDFCAAQNPPLWDTPPGAFSALPCTASDFFLSGPPTHLPSPPWA